MKKNILFGALIALSAHIFIYTADTETVTYKDEAFQYQITRTIDGKKTNIHIVTILLDNEKEPKQYFSTTEIIKTDNSHSLLPRKNTYTGNTIAHTLDDYKAKLTSKEAQNEFKKYNKIFNEKIAKQHSTTIKPAKH